MTTVIEAKGLSKSYGAFEALKDVSFSVPLGRILGVIGANGAGKTTMLNAILGLTRYEGELKVLGKDPAKDRGALMENVCFISDVATLPRWMKVSEILDYVEIVHPNFSREQALRYLERTKIPLDKKIKALSKGMVTQLHLAMVMSIDAQLLVLDEPTLGLDIIFRKSFYSTLLEDYFDKERTIIITTHQVEEIEHILSDVMFIRDGEMVLYSSMEEMFETYSELRVPVEKIEQARALGPISETVSLGQTIFVYEGVSKDQLKTLGDVSAMKLADIFVAKITGGQQ